MFGGNNCCWIILIIIVIICCCCGDGFDNRRFDGRRRDCDCVDGCCD